MQNQENTKNKTTELVFVLDRSGSMHGLEQDTIGGFNSMLEKQKKEDGKVYVSTVLFADTAEVLHDRVDLQSVEPMTEKTYFVGGCTALLDALGRAVFSEQALRTAAKIGAKQYVLLGAGYDTFPYRQPEFGKRLCIFELDRAKTVQDKIARLARAGITPPENVRYLAADLTVSGWENLLAQHPDFDEDSPTFCSLLGLVYYLSTADFVRLLRTLQKLLCAGSTLVFDYPDENAFDETAGVRAQKQAMLARAAGEEMHGGYSLPTLTRLLSDCGFRVYEHLTPDEITAQYFALHNRANPETPLRAFDNVNFCLAVRKE